MRKILHLGRGGCGARAVNIEWSKLLLSLGKKHNFEVIGTIDDEHYEEIYRLVESESSINLLIIGEIFAFEHTPKTKDILIKIAKKVKSYGGKVLIYGDMVSDSFIRNPDWRKVRKEEFVPTPWFCDGFANRFENCTGELNEVDRTCDILVTYHKHFVDTLKRSRPNTEVVYIPYFYDPSDFNDIRGYDNTGKVTIGFHDRFTAHKGTQILFNIIPELHRKYGDRVAIRTHSAALENNGWYKDTFNRIVELYPEILKVEDVWGAMKTDHHNNVFDGKRHVYNGKYTYLDGDDITVHLHAIANGGVGPFECMFAKKILVASNSPCLNWWVTPSRGFLVDKPKSDTIHFADRDEYFDNWVLDSYLKCAEFPQKDGLVFDSWRHEIDGLEENKVGCPSPKKVMDQLDALINSPKLFDPLREKVYEDMLRGHTYDVVESEVMRIVGDQL